MTMTSKMTAQESFQTLKSFFESRNASRQALKSLKEGVEIGVVIGGSVDCALFRRGEQPVVEARSAENPDVIFHIQPESVEILSSQTKDEIADIGINIIREVLAGNIAIKVPGRFLNLLSNGYLDIVKQGGAPVMSYLAHHGLASIAKITATIRKMKG
jgi:hypothetical protein